MKPKFVQQLISATVLLLWSASASQASVLNWYIDDDENSRVKMVITGKLNVDGLSESGVVIESKVSGRNISGYDYALIEMFGDGNSRQGYQIDLTAGGTVPFFNTSDLFFYDYGIENAGSQTATALHYKLGWQLNYIKVLANYSSDTAIHNAFWVKNGSNYVTLSDLKYNTGVHTMTYGANDEHQVVFHIGQGFGSGGGGGGGANPVPEPATIAVWSILGLCGVGYGLRRKLRKTS